MIVKKTEANSLDYAKFLAEAYQYLLQLEEQTGKTIIETKDRNVEETFTSLNQYYKYSEHFASGDKYKHFLLKLPIDEQPFTIDADSRNIKIPPNFVKSSIVQKDSGAETLIFTIDRYIDSIDLANSDNIYVQWTAPDEKGKLTRKKATPIELIDLEDIPNTIKFGWPIDEEVTRYPGEVFFSVAFVMVHPERPSEVLYRLNTLPNSFTVKEALQPEINENKDLNRPYSALHAAIRNSKYPGTGIEVPIPPRFVDPGKDLPLLGDVATSTVLEAQAVINDTGIIDYVWYVTPSDKYIKGKVRHKCSGGKYSAKSNDKINAVERDLITSAKETATSVAISNKEQIVSGPGNDGYYTFVKDFEEVNYKSFPGTEKILFKKVVDPSGSKDNLFVAKDGVSLEEDASGNALTEQYVLDGGIGFKRYYGEETTEPIFEKIAIYELPSSGDIVGEYWVNATNVFSTGEKSDSKDSGHIDFEGPSPVNIKTNLSKNITIMSKPKYGRGEALTRQIPSSVLASLGSGVSPITLVYPEDVDKFEVSNDGVYYCKSAGSEVRLKYTSLSVELNNSTQDTYQYNWQMKTTENGEYVSVPGSTNSTTVYITTPGWYRLQISGEKNRVTLNHDSEVCESKYSPLAPTVLYDRDTMITSVGNGSVAIESEQGSCTILSVSNNNITLALEAKVMDGNSDKTLDPLYSTKFTYAWFEKTPDRSSWTPIENSVGVAANSSTLIVPGNPSQEIKDIVQYKCIVKNVVGDVESAPVEKIFNVQ